MTARPIQTAINSSDGVSSFFFLDECDDQRAGIFSLTGLLVPAERYRDLRRVFYERLPWLVVSAPGSVRVLPPELRGAKMLPDESDDRKHEALEAIVGLALDMEIAVFRVGYRLDVPGASVFDRMPKPWLGLCWFGILAASAEVRKDRLIIPVMDSMNKDVVGQTAGLVTTMNAIRDAGFGDQVSLDGSANIGEVLFADSKYSACTQVVDVISYLRHVSDWHAQGIALEPFKKRLLLFATKVEPFMRCEKIIVLEKA